MTKPGITFILLFNLSQVAAQDLVVLAGGDSLEVKIIDNRHDSLFVWLAQEEKSRKTYFSPGSYQDYQFRYYRKKRQTREHKFLSGISFGCAAGWGYLTGEPDRLQQQAWQQHKQNMRSAGTWQVFGSYFFLPRWGIELGYSRFSNAGQVEVTDFQLVNTIINGTIAEDLSRETYYAVLQYHVVMPNSRWHLLFGFGSGAIRYMDALRINTGTNQGALRISQTVAPLLFTTEVGWRLGEHWLVSLQLQFDYSRFQSAEFTNASGQQRLVTLQRAENISQFKSMLRIRFLL